ncbi:unnamed protein product [Lampetra planeri]
MLRGARFWLGRAKPRTGMAALGAETFLRHRWIVGALLAVPREGENGKGHASGRRRGLASRNAPHVCHVAATAAPSSRRPPGGLVVVVVSSGTGSNGSARSLAVAQPGGAAGTRRRKGGVWSGECYLRQRRGVGVTGRSGTVRPRALSPTLAGHGARRVAP